LDATTRATSPPASKPADRSKTYEFGDTLNLDITATLSSAIQREGLALPLNIEYPTCKCTSASTSRHARRC
jgi:uncharacterized protein with von Willebrand factor type A (vWA) domain